MWPPDYEARVPAKRNFRFYLHIRCRGKNSNSITGVVGLIQNVHSYVTPPHSETRTQATTHTQLLFSRPAEHVIVRNHGNIKVVVVIIIINSHQKRIA